MMNIYVHTKCIYARLTALYENNLKHIHIEIYTSNTYNKHTVVKIRVGYPPHVSESGGLARPNSQA